MRLTFFAAAVLVLAAGCGTAPTSAGVASVSGAGSTPSASPSPTSTLDREERGRKFAQCMRDNDVDMPDPDPNGGFVGRTTIRLDDPKVQKAFEACKEYAPVKERGELSPEDLEKLRKFAACMRDNGVDMPDPDPNGGFAGQVGKIKRDDPDFAEAVEKCNAELGGKAKGAEGGGK
ncbi:hypothetical protein [Thermoactinospora rubra]|uniref:hypothetical protein n=1 Tax=Thermoactinospora rubra TaxID=1088767 RepID=UPI000A0F4731|nr:hypothetical protein [Thermoactinospora rubra]